MLSFDMQACFHAAAYVAVMSYGDRLQTAIDLAKSTRKKVGQALGISEAAVGMVIRGVSGAFTAENSARAARELRVDAHWLATGEGEPRPNDGWPFLSFGPAEYFSLDESLREEVEDRLLGAITRKRMALKASLGGDQSQAA